MILVCVVQNMMVIICLIARPFAVAASAATAVSEHDDRTLLKLTAILIETDTVLLMMRMIMMKITANDCVPCRYDSLLFCLLLALPYCS